MRDLLKFVAALGGCTLMGVVVGAGIVALWQRSGSIWPAIIGGLAGLYFLGVVVKKMSRWLHRSASPSGAVKSRPSSTQ